MKIKDLLKEQPHNFKWKGSIYIYDNGGYVRASDNWKPYFYLEQLEDDIEVDIKANDNSFLDKMLRVFEWLEENANKHKLLYFKLMSDDFNKIGAYFKSDNRHHADFYINTILDIIEDNND